MAQRIPGHGPCVRGQAETEEAPPAAAQCGRQALQPRPPRGIWGPGPTCGRWPFENIFLRERTLATQRAVRRGWAGQPGGAHEPLAGGQRAGRVARQPRFPPAAAVRQLQRDQYRGLRTCLCHSGAARGCWYPPRIRRQGSAASSTMSATDDVAQEGDVAPSAVSPAPAAIDPIEQALRAEESISASDEDCDAVVVDTTPVGGANQTLPMPPALTMEPGLTIKGSIAELLVVLKFGVQALGALAEAEDGTVCFAEVAAKLQQWQEQYIAVQQNADKVVLELFSGCNWDGSRNCWVQGQFDQGAIVTTLSQTIEDVEADVAAEGGPADPAAAAATAAAAAVAAAGEEEEDGSFMDLFAAVVPDVTGPAGRLAPASAVPAPRHDEVSPLSMKTKPAGPEGATHEISPPSGASTLLALLSGSTNSEPEPPPTSRFHFVFGKPLSNTWKQTTESGATFESQVKEPAIFCA